MSRNPYLAASRPTSSFTRSSRTSKRNDSSAGKGSLLGRSRSSVALGGLSASSNPYSLNSSSFVPTSNTWQRSLSSTRAATSDSSKPSYSARDYTPTNQRQSSLSSYETSIPKSSSTHNLNLLVDDGDSDNEPENVLYILPLVALDQFTIITSRSHN